MTAKHSVTAAVYEPATAPKGVLLVHPATATPQGFYKGFAQYAARAGYTVITYDYRGTGVSGVPKDHRSIRMRDWIQQDVAAVSHWAAEHYPQLAHFAVGHSVGGHALVLNYGTENLRGAVIVASHVAAIRTIKPVGERLRVMLILNLIGPAASRVAGYMPGRRLGLGEDIPIAALLEWSRWTRKRDYFFDDPSMQAQERAAQMTVPVLAMGASDDPWASPRQMDLLTGRLRSAPVQRMTLSPEQLGVQRIGHHGLLRRGVGEKAWEQILTWVDSRNQD
ncbi:alpha/beta fold hydrolase [Glutamicibacter sp.]|uniref:alpha/beta hydrolase family protein n=1 Tax=Glutamicibacter sp. TaxID=1931995 RepID=UPI0028BE0888|nr:alpha/beta fold hydrolase [Glutamicibacter sp.]